VIITRTVTATVNDHTVHIEAFSASDSITISVNGITGNFPLSRPNNFSDVSSNDLEDTLKALREAAKEL